jgi:UDP-N-acetylglucosamine diphosphorylase/glucosamine-1-phosphate N-acetyltransferase
MRLCIFEDDQFFKFEPLVFSRPVFDLRLGAFTLREKISHILNYDSYSVLSRNYLKDTLLYNNIKILINEFTEDDYLFVNARLVPNHLIKTLISGEYQLDSVLKNGDVIIAAYISKKTIKKLFLKENPHFDREIFNELSVVECKFDYFTYIWDLIYQNENFINQDIEIFDKKLSLIINNQPALNFHLIEKERIFISKTAKIGFGVVLDASSGAIIVDDNASILHNAVIYGPCYIGKNALVKSNSTIYSGTTIGNFSKVGGEISQSILMDYSNKQHDGFLGHSYLGSWVNLGAGTITSNLKNNYSRIQVELSSGKVDTNLQFIGLLAGDHSKSAIGTTFNTSTVVGFSSNIFGAELTEKFIPSFAWSSIESKSVYELNKAINVAKIVYARREKVFTKIEENLFKEIFSNTVLTREKYGFK